MSIKNVFLRIADRYGRNKMTDDMKINRKTFGNKIDPHQNTHHFYAEEIDLFVATANTDEVAEYFANQRGLMCIPKPDFDCLSDKAILELFLDIQGYCRKTQKS